MGKGKLQKFAEMSALPNVYEHTVRYDEACSPSSRPEGGLKASSLYAQLPIGQPLVLELGCGRGEYTVGLAREFPKKNFIGVDIKGARMWHGAREAMQDGLTNAGFLRTQIEFIDRFFAPSEVSELWLTFCDPQMKKPSKRLTSTYFLERYRRILPDGGLVHLKTDSQFLFTYTRYVCSANNIPLECCIEDVYAEASMGNEEAKALSKIKTYYEQQWIARGINIKYLRFRLPASGTLIEPDVEIPLDSYRSYHREKRSGKETAK